MTDSDMDIRTNRLAALPEQWSRPATPKEPGRAPVVLMADPGDAYGEVFKPQLTGFRILSARSVAEVQQIITTGPPGPLAMVSLRFNGSTPAVIQSLKKAGWSRVLALTLADAPVAPVIDAGASTITITFRIAPHISGGTCEGTAGVAYRVHLDEPIGTRMLVDGACRPPGTHGLETTSFCLRHGVRLRWQHGKPRFLSAP